MILICIFPVAIKTEHHSCIYTSFEYLLLSSAYSKYFAHFSLDSPFNLFVGIPYSATIFPCSVDCVFREITTCFFFCCIFRSRKKMVISFQSACLKHVKYVNISDKVIKRIFKNTYSCVNHIILDGCIT